MKQIDPATQARIDRFMAAKTRQYPELAKKRAQKIPVHQRGRFLDEIAYFFAPPHQRVNA